MICWRCKFDNVQIPKDFLGDFVCVNPECEILNSIYPHPETIKCGWCEEVAPVESETCPKCGSALPNASK